MTNLSRVNLGRRHSVIWGMVWDLWLREGEGIDLTGSYRIGIGPLLDLSQISIVSLRSGTILLDLVRAPPVHRA